MTSRQTAPIARAANLLVTQTTSAGIDRGTTSSSSTRHGPRHDRKPADRAPRTTSALRTASAPRTTSPAPTIDTSTTTFAELGVPTELVGVLNSDGKHTAFPIQVATLPDSLSGRDVLGRGRTGSGKTLAFAIPLVARLAQASFDNTPHRPRGLVLAPTRELATQIAGVIEPLARVYGLRVMTIFGGIKQARQERELARGAAIVVACPGRLEDLMGQRLVSLADIEITVIDEADLMADMGFLPGVTRILRATPANGQRMLFSATLDNGVDRLVKQFLHDPILHSVDSAESPVDLMTHHVFEVSDADTKKDLIEALAWGTGRRIIFFRTKHRAKHTAKQLTAAGIPTVDLQGNLSQNARDRNLAAFESGAVRVLAATDVAARGVDVSDVELVIHADPPREHKEYLHRSGRTARAGHSGDVVTISLPEERRDLAQVLRRAKITVTPQRVTASSPQVSELVGERAAFVKPAPAPAPQQNASVGRSRSRSGARTQSGHSQNQKGRASTTRTQSGHSAGRSSASRGSRSARGTGSSGQNHGQGRRPRSY